MLIVFLTELRFGFASAWSRYQRTYNSALRIFIGMGLSKERFYLHPIHFSIHPIYIASQFFLKYKIGCIERLRAATYCSQLHLGILIFVMLGVGTFLLGWANCKRYFFFFWFFTFLKLVGTVHTMISLLVDGIEKRGILRLMALREELNSKDDRGLLFTVLAAEAKSTVSDFGTYKCII